MLGIFLNALDENNSKAATVENVMLRSLKTVSGHMNYKKISRKMEVGYREYKGQVGRSQSAQHFFHKLEL